MPGAAEDPRDEPREPIQLSVAQVVASSAAAVSAAVVCSYFGVAGTVIGTAAASIVATIGGALYSYSLRRTQARLRRLHLAGAAAPPLTTVMETARGQGTKLFGRIPWRVVLLGTANVFVFSIGLITGLEAILGKPIPAELGVSHGGSDSTSLGSALGSHHHRRSTPAPSTSPTPTPTTSATSPPAVPASSRPATAPPASSPGLPSLLPTTATP